MTITIATRGITRTDSRSGRHYNVPGYSEPFPSVTTVLWNSLSATVPLVGSAIVKIGYDISLYVLFRNVRPVEETQTREARRVVEELAS